MTKLKDPIKPNEKIPHPHENRSTFREAIDFTAGATGFFPSLIEKDYYCSLILRYLYEGENESLIFKGGTALNKIHAGFYRLSEDLDFSISLPSDSPRSLRSRSAKPFKIIVDALSSQISGLSTRTPLTGSNNSTQYNAKFEYTSCVADIANTIKFEIGLREELLCAPFHATALTLVQDPFSRKSLIAPFNVICLSVEESYAEKFRAALSRRQPAIRDLFDLQFGLSQKKINLEDIQFQKLVVKKLSIPGNSVIDLSEKREHLLREQLDLELKPVLRQDDYEKFDFDRAWQNLKEFSKKLNADPSK